jgi:hypothetical protein
MTPAHPRKRVELFLVAVAICFEFGGKWNASLSVALYLVLSQFGPAPRRFFPKLGVLSVGRAFRKFEAFVDLVLKKLLYIKHRVIP